MIGWICGLERSLMANVRGGLVVLKHRQRDWQGGWCNLDPCTQHHGNLAVRSTNSAIPRTDFRTGLWEGGGQGRAKLGPRPNTQGRLLDYNKPGDQSPKLGNQMRNES